MSNLTLLSDVDAQQINGGWGPTNRASARGKYALAVGSIDDVTLIYDNRTQTAGDVKLIATKGGENKVFNGGMVGVVF